MGMDFKNDLFLKKEKKAERHPEYLSFKLKRGGASLIFGKLNSNCWYLMLFA